MATDEVKNQPSVKILLTHEIPTDATHTHHRTTILHNYYVANIIAVEQSEQTTTYL